MLPKGLLKEYSKAIAMVTRLIDMGTMILAAILAYLYKFNDIYLSRPYMIATAIGLLLTPVVFSFFNIYSSKRGQGFFNHIIYLIQAIFVLAMLLAGLAFFTKSGDAFSRTWFVAWMLLAFFFLILCRCSILLFLRFMRAKGLNERRVVILGAGELGTKLAAAVQQAMWTGFRILSFIDDHAAKKPKQVANIKVVQTPPNLGEYLKANDVDEIWLALPLRAEERVKEILHDLRHQTINTRFVLDIFGLDLLHHSITDVAGFPVLNIRSSPMMGINRLVKAIEDRVIAFIILIIISPLFLLISLGVKLSSRGPVFFKQHRLGWDGEIIKVYKFRTMYAHEENATFLTQATATDLRITPFGKFLRRTSLDELPQFINVLQGRMSIVGPRPHALSHNEYYKHTIHTYMQRHRVKPGVTGWAQVNGWRGVTDTLSKMEKRVEYDLFYINNWSLWFDLKIIMLTIIKGFTGRNAY